MLQLQVSKKLNKSHKVVELNQYIKTYVGSSHGQGTVLVKVNDAKSTTIFD